jgi:hypothetical protein
LNQERKADLSQVVLADVMNDIEEELAELDLLMASL